MTMTARERLVPLEGAHNIRDFGGYRTADGRSVAWGRLYRAAKMDQVTEGDAERLRALGITTICDFRRESERAHAPTRWHQHGDTEYVALNVDARAGELAALFHTAATTREDVRQALIDNYRYIPVDLIESYRAMFERLAAGRTPILINCAAGKDRTGIGAALVLAVLGVPREDIYADYLLTNEHLGYDRLIAKDARRRDGSLIERHVYEPLALAHTDYLDTFFAALEGEHGGLDGYLSDRLGIDAVQQDAIRAHLLVS